MPWIFCQLLDEADAHRLSLVQSRRLRRPPKSDGAAIRLHYRAVVPGTLRFPTPLYCKLCGALGTVAPETIIERGVVRMTWCCRACKAEWPVTPSEQ